MELAGENKLIQNRIRRSIPFSVLTDNLIDFYEKFISIYRGDYPVSAFSHF